jgi:hypothetical protein
MPAGGNLQLVVVHPVRLRARNDQYSGVAFVHDQSTDFSADGAAMKAVTR